MSQMVVACNGCGQKYSIAATTVGKRFQCPKCGTTFVAGGASPSPVHLPSPSPDPFAGSALFPPTAPKPQAASGGVNHTILALAIGGAVAVVALLIVAVVAMSLGKSSSPAEQVAQADAPAATLQPAAAAPTPPALPPVAPAALSPPPPATLTPEVALAPPAPPTTTVAAPVAPPADKLPDDPFELSRQLVQAHEERVRLIASVTDIPSAKAVQATYPAVVDRINRIESKLRNRLAPEEEQQKLDELFKGRIDELGHRWVEEFYRVTSLPGVYENMDPDLAPHADMTPYPTELEDLHRDAVRSLTAALTAAKQVKDKETAKEFSGPFRVGNARAAPSIWRMRRLLKLGPNDRNSPDIEALVKAQNEELKRIGGISGAHELLVHGHVAEAAAIAPTRQARVREARIERPAQANAFFSQNPEAVLVRFSKVKDRNDRQLLSRLVQLCAPRVRQIQSQNDDLLMEPVSDLEGFLEQLDFGTVTADRSSRVVILQPNYPLPEITRVAAVRLLLELQSGDEVRVRNAILKLSEFPPGPGREVIGAELVKLLPHEKVRGSAVDAIRQGWLGREQIPLVQEAMTKIRDRGMQGQLVVGISKFPDLNDETIEWISEYYNVDHGSTVESWRNIGPRAEPFIYKYLKHSQADKRKDACKVLGEIGTAASLPYLERMLNDRDRGVVAEASKAILEIQKPADQRNVLGRRPG